jgi:ABC-2 type transport system permease protein
MNKLTIVAVREFVETVKTRAFLFGVIIMPGLVMGLVFASMWIAESASREALPPRTIAILDQDGAFFDAFRGQVDAFNTQNPQQPLTLVRLEPSEYEPQRLGQQLRAGTWYACLVVSPEAIAGESPVQLARRDSQLQTGELLTRMVNEAVQEVRFARSEPAIDRRLVQQLQRPVPVVHLDARTGQPAADDGLARLMTPFAFLFLLYMGTFGISWGLLTSVLEEKNSRVVELLLSAVSPTQLMAGKILGMVGVGVLILLVWGVAGFSAALARGMQHLVDGPRLLYAGLYFVPGFLFMSSLLAAVGAACNTLKEAQSMSSPLTLLNVVPMLLWFQISQYPESGLSLALSFIPPITPFVMVLRVCAHPDLPLWQIVATQAVLWASVGLTIWLAGKVFRVGILMYGKPPTLRELARWVRYS